MHFDWIGDTVRCKEGKRKKNPSLGRIRVSFVADRHWWKKQTVHLFCARQSLLFVPRLLPCRRRARAHLPAPALQRTTSSTLRLSLSLASTHPPRLPLQSLGTAWLRHFTSPLETLGSRRPAASCTFSRTMAFLLLPLQARFPYFSLLLFPSIFRDLHFNLYPCRLDKFRGLWFRIFRSELGLSLLNLSFFGRYKLKSQVSFFHSRRDDMISEYTETISGSQEVKVFE